MAIRLDETKMEAHYISQSIVEFMYKTIYYFVYSAEDVQLPEELLKEPAARKTSPACKSNIKSCEAHSGCGRRSVKNKLKQATENLKKPNK